MNYFVALTASYSFPANCAFSTQGGSTRSSVSEQSREGVLQENSSMKFILCPVEVIVSSDMVERISKFVRCAMDHDYEPYSKQSSGIHLFH